MPERVNRQGTGRDLVLGELGDGPAIASGSTACSDDRHRDCAGISSTGGRCICACHAGRVDRLDKAGR